MIKVIVEVWPGGDESRRHQIASMDIANVSNLAGISSYDAILDQYEYPLLEIPARRYQVHVDGHPRNAAIFSLLKRVFAAWDS